MGSNWVTDSIAHEFPQFVAAKSTKQTWEDQLLGCSGMLTIHFTISSYQYITEIHEIRSFLSLTMAYGFYSIIHPRIVVMSKISGAIVAEKRHTCNASITKSMNFSSFPGSLHSLQSCGKRWECCSMLC